MVRIVEGKLEAIPAACARRGVARLYVFGSALRDGFRPGESDVDLLVDVIGEPSPWFPGGLVADLEELLGRPVQVVIRRSLSSLIRESVLTESTPL